MPVRVSEIELWELPPEFTVHHSTKSSALEVGENDADVAELMLAALPPDVSNVGLLTAIVVLCSQSGLSHFPPS